LPDTQFYCDCRLKLSAKWGNGDLRRYFFAQTEWVRDNQKRLNIAFLVHEGDIVQADAPGIAAAMAGKSGKSVQAVDVKSLQDRLLELGIPLEHPKGPMAYEKKARQTQNVFARRCGERVLRQCRQGWGWDGIEVRVGFGETDMEMAICPYRQRQKRTARPVRVSSLSGFQKGGP
jgi:hypothetical protein